MGFNIGSVFLELLADGARLKADIERQATAAADAAGAKAGQTLGDRLASTLTRQGKVMQTTGMTLTKNVTAPVVGLGAAIFATGAQFDTALRQIVALTDVTADEIGGVKDRVLELAQAIGKDPNELAQGFYFLASAGFDTAEAMTVLESTAKASAAGLGDTADISRVVGAAINAFGKENLTASDAVDQLLRAVKDGTAEAPDFANALGDVLGTAGQMGATFADTTAAISAMTLKGIGADEAATSLNQVFVSLLKTTPKAEGALKDLGLSSEGLRKQLKEKGLLAVLQTLEKAFAGNDTAAAEVFGNVRALRGVLALTGGDAAQVAKVFDDVASGTANLADAFEATEGPGRDLDRAFTEIKVALIEIGDDALPLISDGLRAFTGLIHGAVGAFKGLPEPIRTATIVLLGLAATAGPVVYGLGKITSGLGMLVRGAGKLGRLAGPLAEGLASGLDKVPGSGLVKAGVNRLGTFLGTSLGAVAAVGFAAALWAAAIAVANRIDDETRAQQGGIAASVADQVMQGNIEGLKASKAALEQGIKDLQDNLALTIFDIPGTFQESQIAKLQEQLDAVNAALADAGMSGSGAYASGVTAGAPAVEKAGDDMMARLRAAVIPEAEDIGESIPEAIGEGTLAKQGVVADAFDRLKMLMKSILSPAKQIARDIGILTSKALARGLNDKRPEVRAQAQLVQQQAEEELAELIASGGKAGKDAMDELRKKMNSKNPEVRAAAQRVYEIVKDKLDKVPPAAADAGGKAGTSLLRSMQATINRGGGVTVKVTATGDAHGGGRAAGGPVAAGIPYLVNERTPRSEIFVPSVSGQVVTHADAVRAIGAAAGGGGDTINLNVPITGYLKAETPSEVAGRLRQIAASGVITNPRRRRRVEVGNA